MTVVDEALAHLALFYVKYYMDDILVRTLTRWKLRRAVQVVNQVLTSLQLAKHPDKRCIGRIARGFDCWGYHFSPYGLRVATQTLANFIARPTASAPTSVDTLAANAWSRVVPARNRAARRHEGRPLPLATLPIKYVHSLRRTTGVPRRNTGPDGRALAEQFEEVRRLIDACLDFV
jgi:hypothetical protein